MTISQFLPQYLVLRVSHSKQYLANVRLCVSRFVEANGDIFLGDITEEHIGRFLAVVGKTARSSYTLRGHLAMLKAILNEAFNIGLLPRLPRFPRIRLEKRDPDAWTIEEVQKLFKHVWALPGSVGVIPARLWWGSLLLTNYYTGLRLSALLNVTWFQIDFRGFLRAYTNKNKREQTFALPQDLVQLLREIQYPPREKVWEHPYRDPKWPCKALRRIVDRAGIPAPKTLHGQLFQKMRRTCITWTAVYDLNTATRVAGHASPQTTIRHYVDPRMLGAIQPAVPRVEFA